MKAAAWGALGSFTASAVALFVTWLNGRREHKARLREEEAEARQVLIDEVTHHGVWIKNHSAMYVTTVQVQKAKLTALYGTDRIPVEYVATGGEVAPVLEPQTRAFCAVEWKPAPDSPENAPTLPKHLIPSPWSIRFTYFDSRGTPWKRTGHHPPERRKIYSHVPGARWWKPKTWKVVARWLEPVELISVKRDL
ncbi:hypothetical protein [Streptomyces chartreusis]|uniref:hypothetical protein n=1 Tax=Streptomyces chartreusis TaxID=1969 RepID=UPI0038014914